MIRTFDPAMLSSPHSALDLIPFLSLAGFQAVSLTPDLLEDPLRAAKAKEEASSRGIGFGLLPMPADFYHWELSDAGFDRALEELKRRAEIAERLGAKAGYNHVWPASTRPFEENFAWHVSRVARVAGVLREHGIRYGLEFLGPHELRAFAPYGFLHSLEGILSLADAAGNGVGVAFDTFHWFTSEGGDPKDLGTMTEKADRLVCVHLNDAVAGVPFDRQKDMVRRFPMETGVIDSRAILRGFREAGSDALFMIEPFEPGRTLFHALSPEEAARRAGEILRRVEE